MTKQENLQSLSFGHRIAEEETGELASYFVETDQWRRILAGDIDVVYGSKGSGKSAIYAVLLQHRPRLFERNILIVGAENPRGTPAFKDLVVEPPASEAEFIGLWKLYLLTLIAGVFVENGIENDAAKDVVKTLRQANLVVETNDLRKILRGVADYVRALAKLESVQGGVELDPITGMIKGLTGKLTLREPSQANREAGILTIDSLFAVADRALQSEGFYVWVALDRLDVAFAEKTELEQNALRDLFKVYIELFAYDRIKLKIFLRSDIWKRITQAGFREASHITKHVTITWNPQTLMNLLIRRALKNKALCEYYSVSETDVLRDHAQQIALFQRVFPEKVDPGAKKPATFVWMLSRIRDGTRQAAPRELIHLISAARDAQVRQLEVGKPEPTGECLFAGDCFKEALKEVSEVRLHQTLFAEYPQDKDWILRLKGAKTQQTGKTLSAQWGVDEAQALRLAGELVEIGFFEERGTSDEPQFWVPFLYRDAADLVQGSAEVDDNEENQGTFGEIISRR